MEITKVFKACVKAASVKGKKPLPSRILPTREDKKCREDSFNKRSAEVISNISKLQEFLVKYQTEYICDFSPLVSISSKMSEEERQQIDADAQTFIKSCSNAISSLRGEAESFKNGDQYKTHSLAVMEILEAYLKAVCKLYSQQRAIRVKQTIDRKKMARLKPDKSYIKDRQTETRSSNRKNGSEDILDKKLLAHDKEVHQESYSSAISNVPTTMPPEYDRKTTKEIYFTKEETQMFEEENEQLYQEMNNIVKEINSIEGKVVEIGRLQEVFQEKVLSQADQIESIGQTAVATTENVKEGNEQIREAIKNSATFRVWILFFLVMCTFSLLFLDWYND